MAGLELSTTGTAVRRATDYAKVWQMKSQVLFYVKIKRYIFNSVFFINNQFVNVLACVTSLMCFRRSQVLFIFSYRIKK